MNGQVLVHSANSARSVLWRRNEETYTIMGYTIAFVIVEVGKNINRRNF